jgi:hypothetical protein
LQLNITSVAHCHCIGNDDDDDDDDGNEKCQCNGLQWRAICTDFAIVINYLVKKLSEREEK